MKIHNVPKKALQKMSHNRCITLRATSIALAQWKDEAKGRHKSLSGMLDEKIHNALHILFSAIPEVERI